ncbi:MAG: hypothetical protein L0387_04430 [Acidobacteria bacterium]|nr:hypothetical protein [Acidobacteriota bacterium]MCI0720373.1 hypothetical protein [Acidobacteriota bacterium]
MNLPQSLPGRRVCFAVFVISASILMLELVLTRIFSVKLYYHYAFMVISLALLGSGASGVYVYLFPNFFRRDRLERQLFLACWLFAASIPLTLALILRLDFQFDFTLRQLGRILLLYSIPAVPFFLGGLCLSLAMTHLAENVSRLYSFDLAGAACGCLLVIPLLNVLGGPQAMLSIASLAAAVCWLLLPSGGSRSWLWIPLFLVGPITAFLILSPGNPWLKIQYVKGRNEGEALFSKWDSSSRITVVQVNRDRKNTWIIMDGDAGTLLPDFDGNIASWRFLQARVSSLAYHIKPSAQTLIVGPGGGIDVLTALTFGNREITGVEVNPITVNDVMREQFKDFTGGLYFRPEVQIHVDEGRSFIRRAAQSYDIIQATLVDTWAATAAGAFALTENNLYTVEAFKDYFSKLKDDGILTFTRWNLEPPQQDLRLVSLTRAAMQELGLSGPERSMIIVRESRQREAVECNFLFKKSGFTDEEVQRIEAISQANAFEMLYTPLTRPDNPFTKLITAANPRPFYDSYPYDVSPPRDNSPFFFHTVRLRQVWSSLFLSWESKKTNVGLLVLFLVFLAALVLVLLFILVPLYGFRKKALSERRGSSELGYFVCLGLGFILIEMTLVQKFILFLGRPVYALSVVLFATLLFSGLGSLFSGRLPKDRLRRSISAVCLLVAALVLAYLPLLPFFLYRFVGLTTPLKALLVIAFLAPLGFVMGMPMPLGIQWLQRVSPPLIPWAWGINGSASVLGSILTMVIAVNLGFNQALTLAIGLYLLAALFLFHRHRSEAFALPAWELAHFRRQDDP